MMDTVEIKLRSLNANSFTGFRHIDEVLMRSSADVYDYAWISRLDSYSSQLIDSKLSNLRVSEIERWTVKLPRTVACLNPNHYRSKSTVLC